MKLLDASILSISLALMVVGIHQTWTNGIGFSYPLFMLAVGLLFWFQLRRNKVLASNHQHILARRKGKNAGRKR